MTTRLTPGVLATVLALAACALPRAINAQCASDRSPPPGTEEIDVSVATPAGHHLRGTLWRPAGSGPVPAVVLVAGSGRSDRNGSGRPFVSYCPLRDLAVAIVSRGVAVVRLDDRGVGASTGEFSAATTADFAEDTRAAVEYLRALPGIHADRIAVVGHSEGAIVTMLLAGPPTTLAAAVLLAPPAVTGREAAMRQMTHLVASDTTVPARARDSTVQARVAEWQSGLASLGPWINWLWQYDPLATARRITIPALVIGGATDWQVPSDQVERIAGAMRANGNARVRLEILPALNHLFVSDPQGARDYAALGNLTMASEVTSLVADWLSQTLRVHP